MRRRVRRRRMSETCPCGWKGEKKLGHYAQSPTCRPSKALDAPIVKDLEPILSNMKSSPSWTRARTALESKVHGMHCKDLMSLADIVKAVELAELLAAAVLGQWTSDLDSITKETNAICQVLKRVSTVVSKVSTQIGALVPVDRPKLAEPRAAKKRYACLSLTQQIVQMLVESKSIRTHCRSTSSYWKSGALLAEPSILRDRTDGLRFRRSRSARRALPSETKRLRIGLVDWSDEYTVRAKSLPKLSPR